ncbi:hypothetical protein JYK14_09235 [Siccirubricoccus sp. KC 17139]|uniref:PepSY domain-containing protein n=1 Tax=Siccirubricoccus soli TaxID=2899147 RepID=A0ABT1D336_9PROT|nr:hypothetical protein [Siccirubricoccus soli]MCO6416349.1 hypothetical protein [Siccirubricoccus soli]MCP2682483.1 hypothetical protein [Siccirubricoccus soli]
MRSKILGLALLGAAVSLPVAAQVSPAAPDRARPNAATEGTTRPGMTAPDATSGATTPNRSNESSQPAVRTDNGTRTADAPVPGANSFTEGQARSRIEAAGFSDVSELRKDDQGIWRGRAMRSGQQVGVALDYQGNVTSR